MPRTSPASLVLHVLMTAWVGMALVGMAGAAPREPFQDQQELGDQKTEDSILARVRKTRSVGNSRSESPEGAPHFLYFRVEPPGSTEVRLQDSLVLECAAGGNPPPTIHWLKDGIKIRQEGYSNAIPDAHNVLEPPRHGVSTTKSRLQIDCFSAVDQGAYTCVANTPFQRISSVSNVFLTEAGSETSNSCSTSALDSPGQVPRVYLWTGNLVQTIGREAILLCRGVGDPYPKVTWYNGAGDVLRNSNKYRTMDSGDLRIRRLKFDDMGLYRCESENKFGKDSVSAFLYSLATEDK